MVKSRKYIYSRAFGTTLLDNNFAIVEEELPPLQEGEFLVEAQYLSVDPYMRTLEIYGVNIGDTLTGCQVAKIVDSKNEKFPIDNYIYGYLPCATYSINNGMPSTKYQLPTYIVPDQTLPLSLYIGALGTSGNTAYFGLTEICKVKSGETIAITAAAGGVGHLVGQIAKILGCKVIGFTSSPEKCDWLKSICFDHAINYKTENLEKAISKAAPNGIDCYFDNVGGELSSVIMNKMNTFGRVAVCGSISSYTKDFNDMPKITIIQPTILYKQLTVTGFLINEWKDRWMEGIEQNIKWVHEGNLRPQETIVEGFQNFPTALEKIFKGENFGKTIVKV